ncbi:MAG TPA: hypothetical protein VKU41_08365 [Polyangiaceae bacterium]|nr:hypothetical protein [Polyangiaceae bacterium]
MNRFWMLGFVSLLTLAGGPLACSSSGGNAPDGGASPGCADCSVVPGSYVQTCAGCSHTATLLTCTGCYDSSGQQHQTSLALPCPTGPANDQGMLVCPADPNAPSGSSPGDAGSTGNCATLASVLDPAQSTGAQACTGTTPVSCGTNTQSRMPCCCGSQLGGGTSVTCVTGGASYAQGCGFCEPNTAKYGVVCGLGSTGAPWACPTGTTCILSSQFDPNTWPYACCPEGEQCTSLCH